MVKRIVFLALMAPALLLTTPTSVPADRGDRHEQRGDDKRDDAYKHREDDKKGGWDGDKRHDGRDDKDRRDSGRRDRDRDRDRDKDRDRDGDYASGRGYDGIPPGHLPPPGHCRDWIPGRPPGHQPPPYKC